MYVPWIHGDARVPEWWKELVRWACGRDASDPTSPWLKALIRKWERERAELDAAIAAMPPLNLRPEWPGYDIDALEPWEEGEST